MKLILSVTLFLMLATDVVGQHFLHWKSSPKCKLSIDLFDSTGKSIDHVESKWRNFYVESKSAAIDSIYVKAFPRRKKAFREDSLGLKLTDTFSVFPTDTFPDLSIGVYPVRKYDRENNKMSISVYEYVDLRFDVIPFLPINKKLRRLEIAITFWNDRRKTFVID